MKRTKALFCVLLLIILAFGFYNFIKNYDTLSTTVYKVINKYGKKKVIIPTDTKYHRTYLFDTVSETDDFEPKNIEDIKKIYYTVLNNGWSNFTFYCSDEYTDCISDVKTIANSQTNSFISLINNYVSPYNSYQKYNTSIKDKNEIKLSIEKLYTEDEINRIEAIIDKYLKKNNIDSNNVSKDDIKKIHDYIIKITSYDEKYEESHGITDSNKATGVFFNNKALCSGYSDAFAMFMDKINVPNFEVTSEAHEWNAIYFNNKWYHIDTTWDDDEENSFNTTNFFLINTKELLKKDKKEHNFSKDRFLEFK